MVVTQTKEVKTRSGELEIGPVGAHELDAVVGVLARGMRDNPTHVAVYGEDPEVRRQKIERSFSGAARALHWDQHMLVARTPDGTIVAACGMMPPGACQPSPRQQLRLLPLILGSGLPTALRTMRWLGTWAKSDPDERHWHVGPLAVDAPLQGQGIGSRLMEVFCARMDEAGEDAYLETDKPINVTFYQRFGFEVVAEQPVLGRPNWFMLRRARGTG